jgi:flagellar protein FliJ
MPPKLPIGTLTDLARSRTEEAARKLAALRNANMSASRKLELLLQYRRDYGQQLQAMMLEGLGCAQLRNYQDFLRALDAGVEEQRIAAAQAEARLGRGRSDWQQQHRRLNAFETLAERLHRQALITQGRREQRANDEQASRMALHCSPGVSWKIT